MAITKIKKQPVIATSIDTTAVRLRDFTDPTLYHLVNMHAKTCSCLAFSENHIPCVHLNALGIHKETSFTPKTNPTFSQALSGLVKGIRLRDKVEAAYWLYYLWKFPEPSNAFRLARRLFIGAAEDGFNLPTIQRISETFPELCSIAKRDQLQGMAEIIRLCNSPNWWDASSGGHAYIKDWATAVRKVDLYNEYPVLSYGDLLTKLEKAIKDGDTASACGYFTRFDAEKMHVKHNEWASVLGVFASKVGSTHGVMLNTVYQKHKSALAGDTNFTGHILYWSCKKDAFPHQEYEPVLKGNARALLHQVKEMWEKPHYIPSWCCDGIHCAGSDRRFAGMTDQMATACNVFTRTGELNPLTPWQPSDWYLGGLYIER